MDGPSEAPASVLLLESDCEDAGQILQALSEFKRQFRAQWVMSLSSAVSALVDTDFDCLIVGLGLVDAQGLEIVEVLRDASNCAAVIVLTDRDDALVGFRAIQGGVDDYLVRGELAYRDPHDLCLSVQYAIERARLKTELMAAEQTARALSAVVESTADAILTKNAHGIIKTWNRGAEQLYGYRAEEVVGKHVDLLHPWNDEESHHILSAANDGETMRGMETVHRLSSGDLIHVSLTVSPLRGPNDEHLGASVIARDITDRRRLEEQLTQQAMHDTLTGLPNRALLMDRMRQALAEIARSDESVAILFLDLDMFKELNDSRGHRAGDELLVEVADRLQRVVRPTDTVARLGGDEFVVICRNSDAATAVGVAGRIAEALAEASRHGDDGYDVRASIGIAVAPPVAAEAELMLQYADAAMYAAKEQGGNRVQVFEGTFAAHSKNRLQLEEDLREALRLDALELHYQPIVDLASGRLVGVEALARWNHADQGHVPPTTFMPLAEETGLIAQLDRWVLSRACQDTAVLRESGVLAADARVAVNLSARTVGHPHLGVFVRDTMVEHRLPAEALVLEVTETAVLHDPSAARRSLEALREVGVGVALDDFGTGYSSLTFLRQLPVTHVKIDRSFVSQIAVSREDRAIAACIIDLARKLEIDVIAEGVETPEQLTTLRQLGCSLGQGYHWSRPVPLDQLSELLVDSSGPAFPRQLTPTSGATGTASLRRSEPTGSRMSGR